VIDEHAPNDAIEAAARSMVCVDPSSTFDERLLERLQGAHSSRHRLWKWRVAVAATLPLLVLAWHLKVFHYDTTLPVRPWPLTGAPVVPLQRLVQDLPDKSPAAAKVVTRPQPKVQRRLELQSSVPIGLSITVFSEIRIADIVLAVVEMKDVNVQDVVIAPVRGS
jgi:hypothetical protein